MKIFHLLLLERQLCFKHNIVCSNWILLCLNCFSYLSTFPDFQSLRANFPNSEGPAPIPKILKRNTGTFIKVGAFILPTYLIGWPRLNKINLKGCKTKLEKKKYICRKNAKNSDIRKYAVITLKFEQGGYHRVICPKDADRITNSVDPDNWPDCVCTVSQTCLFEN